MVEMGGRPLYC